MTILIFIKAFRDQCQPFDETIFSPYLAIVRASPEIIALTLFLLSLILHEVWLLSLSVGSYANWALNVALKRSFLQAVPVAGCVSFSLYCGPDGTDACGMPAFNAQYNAFLVTSQIIYTYQWHAPHVRQWHIFGTMLWMSLVNSTHLYFNFNSAAQLIVGTAVGCAFALVWQLFVFAAIYPYYDRILRWRIISYFGYRDTWCKSDD